MEKGGHLTLTGLFGHPVGHSRSPQMHNAAFAALGLPYVYVAFDVHPDRLRTAAESIRALGIRGVNVTIPHKVEVMKYLDRIAPEADMIGAVNTIVNENGVLVGHNTDGSGYVRSLLEETKLNLADAKVLVLGAGGAARAVVSALAMKGAGDILIVNRTREKGDELARRISSLCKAHSVTYDDLPELMQDVRLVVNTTSVGMYPQIEECPLDTSLLHEGLVVSDLIYNPLETRLLREARLRGAIPHGGLGMFVYQGAEAFTLWTSVEAPVAIMRKAIKEK
ncbi:shikimate dehydrogenase [Effusibacillus lacus]|uniref:Shikimate dehydrogenase (NADP(+)) n=1 Tax=Effusibacillus lacus TaxID=1348429 RepID=A0A292YK00_9BACL|nr:shikimate dehydrogenase [Effusibacillus lacus]TCS72846.1 shikimate dehydrogenase [Effusibacillus lacus]GAX89229.1 shikimate dehydrogenase [Effusibacillus lacus]